MAKINLLPWREERREQLRKEFLAVLKRDRLETTRHPMLFANVVYDFFGDLDRESYFIVMKDQRAQQLEKGGLSCPQRRQSIPGLP